MSVQCTKMRGARTSSKHKLLAKASSIDWTGSRSPHRQESSEGGQEAMAGPHAQPVAKHQPLAQTDSRGKVDIRTVYGEAESRVAPSNTAAPSGRPKQPLRKTLSDNVAYSRREDLTVEDLTLEDNSEPRLGRGSRGVSSMSKGGVAPPDSYSSSCPNLIQGGSSAPRGKVYFTGSSGGNKTEHQRPLSSDADSTRDSQRKTLNVPDIFVTSFTHSDQPTRRPAVYTAPGRQESLDTVASDPEMTRSAHVPTVIRGGGAPGPHSLYRHSAPELSRFPLGLSYWGRLRESLRTNLNRSTSDNAALPSRPNLNSKECVSCDACAHGRSGCSCSEKQLFKKGAQQRAVNEPRTAKVLSYLYIGNLETSYDERLTCRLGIRSVIDLSNMTPEDVPSTRRNPAPCMCGHEDRHLKATLRLGLDDTHLADTESSFTQINKFIEGARKVEKKVLVVCRTGNSVSALAVMQYLMVHRGCNLRKAYSMVMRQGADIDLSSGHQVLLQTLERRLLPSDEQSLCFERRRRDSLGVPCRTTYLTREAWTPGDSDI